MRGWVIFFWIVIIMGGAFLRFEDLAKRPFHADEATGARITSSRMEAGNYQFDPFHYHGPILSGLAIPICRIRGEQGWEELTKLSLRILPALAGSLLLCVPLMGIKRFGMVPMLLASAMLATSPLLIYYSRMFIHEILLVLFGLLTMFSVVRFPRYGIPGLCLGLMFAAKESFAISVIAWGAAGCAVAWSMRAHFSLLAPGEFLKEHRQSILLSCLMAGVVSLVFYTDGLRHPQGAIDAVKTFFVYETVAGHEKPFWWYGSLLVMPSKSGGLWWFGTPVVVMAMYAFFSNLRGENPAALWIRFFGYAALGHFLIYSLISYKTPWLACLPWAHVCVLAGLSMLDFSKKPVVLRGGAVLFAGWALFTQLHQARAANGRLASDERNPFAYVPTRNEMETLEPWLLKLQHAAPSISLQPIAVIGRDYWPLPWYLKSFDQLGYWPNPPQNVGDFPLVFAMPDHAEAVANALDETHTALPRALRAGGACVLYVRNNLWNAWMDHGK